VLLRVMIHMHPMTMFHSGSPSLPPNRKAITITEPSVPIGMLQTWSRYG
jgi:hypothetical protein